MRREHDYYPTPAHIAEYAVEQCVGMHGGARTLLEPGCGDAAPFASHARFAHYIFADACDIRDVPRGFVRDFLEHDFGLIYDIIATNPPYKLAQEFIEKSLSILAPNGIACFLLRIGFLASQKRVPFFAAHPLREVHVLMKRPSFTGDGKTDGSEYGLFFWDGETKRGKKDPVVKHTLLLECK